MQPSSHNGEVTFVNALFTATSAISVTGLGVVDTGTAFTLQGQIFLLMLMEIGGLGQMTMTLLLIAIFSKRVGLRQQVLAKEALGQEGSVNIIQLVKRIVLFAFIAQLIGTGIMAIRWVPRWVGCTASMSASSTQYRPSTTPGFRYLPTTSSTIETTPSSA